MGRSARSAARKTAAPPTSSSEATGRRKTSQRCARTQWIMAFCIAGAPLWRLLAALNYRGCNPMACFKSSNAKRATYDLAQHWTARSAKSSLVPLSSRGGSRWRPGRFKSISFAARRFFYGTSRNSARHCARSVAWHPAVQHRAAFVADLSLALARFRMAERVGVFGISEIIGS